MWYLCIIWLKFSFNMTWRIQLCRRGLTACRATSGERGGGGGARLTSRRRVRWSCVEGEAEVWPRGRRPRQKRAVFALDSVASALSHPPPSGLYELRWRGLQKVLQSRTKLKGVNVDSFSFFFWWGGKERRCNFTHALSFMSKYFYSCTFFFRDCKVVLLFGTLIRSIYYIYRCLDFLWEDIY